MAARKQFMEEQIIAVLKEAGTKPPSPRPLSIKIIAAFFVLVALPVIFVYAADNFVFGVRLTGLAVIPYNIFVTSLYLLAGIGLWKLWEPARRLAIVLQCYFVVNLWMTYANPSYRELMMHAVGAKNPGLDQASIQVFVPAFLGIGGLLKTLRTGFILWFLIKRKAAFVKPSLSA